jgi:DNA-binding IclR family transcriptional regulator
MQRRPAAQAIRTAAGEGSSLSRMLGVVDLFSEQASVWTVDDIALALGYTRATAYRYVGELHDAGLLTRVGRGAYALGPRIIELDRQIRRCDPLLVVGESVMRGLLKPNRGQVVLLCSLFRDKVLCIHQEGHDQKFALSYARGRPMPLFRGATSKAILAYMTERRLTRLYLDHQAEIGKAGLGGDRTEFLAALKAIRKQGYAMTHADVDPGVVGVGVPLFGGERAVIGSLSVVFDEMSFPARQLQHIVADLQRAAETFQERLARIAQAPPQRISGTRTRQSVEHS